MSQQINLFNPIFLKQKKYFSAATMAQALGLILLGCLALAGYVNLQVAKLEQEADAAAVRLGHIQAQLDKVNAAYGTRKKDETLAAAIQKTESDIQALRRLSDTLQGSEFGDSRGYAEYMRAFARQIPQGLWLTGFDIQGGGSDIGLHGRALHPELVAGYLGRLKREPVLQGKSFATLDISDPSITSRGEADASEPGTRVGTAYVEFSLRSSGAMKSAAESGGADRK